jgi:D-alanyl-D-alanine carboxypeptidase
LKYKIGIPIVIIILAVAGFGGWYFMQQQPATPAKTSSQKSAVSKDAAQSTSSSGAQFTLPVIKSGTEAAKLLMVVNKRHPLPADYNPYNGASTGKNPDGAGLLPAAQQAKDAIIKAMQAAGFAVSDNISGYRSYAYQKSLYDGYVASNGQAWADKYSARPGYSEHQSGLAFDLVGADGELPTDDKMYAWLLQHAHTYGLIIRYPRNMASVTGYEGEEWHLRYIGVKFATEMYDHKITTLEQFTGMAGGDYNADPKNDVPALEEYK